MSNPKLN
ncbi:hypothetical protein Anas_10992, partial [Armadillidium nasatum]